MSYLMVFYGKNGYANAPQSCLILVRTLPVKYVPIKFGIKIFVSLSPYFSHTL